MTTPRFPFALNAMSAMTGMAGMTAIPVLADSRTGAAASRCVPAAEGVERLESVEVRHHRAIARAALLEYHLRGVLAAGDDRREAARAARAYLKALDERRPGAEAGEGEEARSASVGERLRRHARSLRAPVPGAVVFVTWKHIESAFKCALDGRALRPEYCKSRYSAVSLALRDAFPGVVRDAYSGPTAAMLYADPYPGLSLARGRFAEVALPGRARDIIDREDAGRWDEIRPVQFRLGRLIDGGIHAATAAEGGR